MSTLEEVTKERDALRARLAEIEAQEPAGWQQRTVFDGEWSDWQDCNWRTANILRQREDYEVRPVYARPVPAQAVPEPDRPAACDELQRCSDGARRGNGRSAGAQGMSTKIIYFKERTPTPLKVVKDKGAGCAKCFFRSISMRPDGCPTEREERQAGAGRGCVHEGHHYEVAV